MKRKKAYLVVLVILMAVSLLVFGCTQQEDPEEPDPVEEVKPYPTRAIVVTVGFSPGGPGDVIGRGILPVLQDKIGVGVAITNMPGASGSVAANEVLRNGQDGYSALFGTETMSLWQVMDVLNATPTEDFIPIKLVSQAIPVLAVPPDSPFNSAEEFIEYAKANPGKLRIGTAGPATVPHVSGIILQQELGCEFTFVPFQGGAPAIAATMGGQVDATIEMVQSMVQAHSGGLIKLLSSFTMEPVKGLEGIPALGQIYPEMANYLPYGPYFGLFVHKDVPENVVEALTKGMDEAIQDDRWKAYCERLLLVPIDYSGQEAIDFLIGWRSKAAWLLYDAGVAPKSPADFGIDRPQ